jgi:hypothetical protein
VFIYYVGKFGGKHGELEFGRGLRQTEFCTTDINGRIVGEVKVDTLLLFCRIISSNIFMLKELSFLCRIILSNHYMCVKFKQLLCYIRCLCRSIDIM